MSKEAKKEQKEVSVVQFDAEEQSGISIITDALIRAKGYEDNGQWLNMANWLRQKVQEGEKKNVDA